MKRILLSLTITIIACAQVLAVQSTRIIKSVSAKEVSVEVTVDKDSIGGFARLSEHLPSQTSIISAYAEGGTYTFKDSTLKFIWMALPSSPKIKVTYVVNVQNLSSGIYLIEGTFAYVVAGRPTDTEIASTAFNIPEVVHSFGTNQQVSQPAQFIKPVDRPKEGSNTDGTTSDITYLTTAPTSKAAPTANSSASTSTSTSTSPSSSSLNAVSSRTTASSPTNASSTPPPTTASSRLYYAIQLFSSTEQKNPDHIKHKFNLTEIVRVESLDGQYKFVVGNYKSLTEAETARVAIQHKGCKDAFVVPYLNNKRITMNEALKNK